MPITPKLLTAGIIFLILTVILALPVLNAQSTTSTFGTVNVGSSSTTTFGGIITSNFTSPLDLANITAIKVYLATGGTTAKAVIYADNGSSPGILLTESAPINVEGTSGAWVTFDLSYDGIPETQYWLGVVLSSASSYYYAENVTGKGMCSGPLSNTINSFPTPISVGKNALSVYAIYNPITATPQPNQTQEWISLALVLIAVIGVIFAIILAVAILLRKGKKSE
jgi:hypothetical protein